MKKRISGFIIFAAAAFLVLVALGTWQLQRRAEKFDLIARHEAALHAPAKPFPIASSWSATDFKKLEYAKVALEGHFLPLPEIHLYALLPKIKGKMGGVGWWVIMPFELSDGGIVFVNRGFVPQEQKYPALRPKSLALPGMQTLQGLVRLPEEPGHFTPTNDLKTNEWYVRDPSAYADYESLDRQRVAPVVIDQLSSNLDPLPQPSDGKFNLPNNHLSYAITWYVLALVLLIISILFEFKRRKPVAQV